MYVLGPLELSPNNFAVGERSYAAIKGNMPYYNGLRQKLYVKGNKQAAEAIGELEARAEMAEEELKSMTSSRDSYKSKLEDLKKEFDEFKKENVEAIKNYAKIKVLEVKNEN